jgi:hypothetical protein
MEVVAPEPAPKAVGEHIVEPFRLPRRRADGIGAKTVGGSDGAERVRDLISKECCLWTKYGASGRF